MDQALAFVARNTRQGIRITGRPERETIPEYPDAGVEFFRPNQAKMLREALAVPKPSSTRSPVFPKVATRTP